MMVSTQTSRRTFRDSLVARVEAKSEELFRAASHLLSIEGKAIRPRCVRLIAQAANPDVPPSDAHERLAEAVELLHVGSLIHDDILDEAEVRRGVAAVHVPHGMKAAVLAGDFLLSKSCGLIASLGSHELNRRMAEVLAGLCEGEFQQDEQLFDLNVTLDAYLDRVALKTSGPFELACEGAALLGGMAPHQVEDARRFGFHLGRLFQMYDDLLDWSSSDEIAGKPVGQDLLAGSVTLPVLAALADPAVGPQLRALLDPFPREIRPEVKELLFRPTVFRRALAWVESEVDAARQCLVSFPDTPACADLHAYLMRLSEQTHTLSPEHALATVELTPHAAV